MTHLLTLLILVSHLLVAAIGNATTLNFIGAGNTFAVNGSTIDISIAGGGGGGGGANVNISTSTPSSPSSGDLWWDSDDGGMNIYYDDGNTSQWVEVSTGPTGAQGDTGAQGAAGAARCSRNQWKHWC